MSLLAKACQLLKEMVETEDEQAEREWGKEHKDHCPCEWCRQVRVILGKIAKD